MEALKSLTELIDMWKTDCIIQKDEYINELARIPKLHQKYQSYLTIHTAIMNKINEEYKKDKLFFYRYLTNKNVDPDELEKYKVRDKIGEKILNKDIDIYLDGEERLSELLTKYKLHESIVDYCKSVVKQLNDRTFQIRAAVDWQKHIDGK